MPCEASLLMSFFLPFCLYRIVIVGRNAVERRRFGVAMARRDSRSLAAAFLTRL